MKTTVIHHSADYDGLFCCEIARKFLPEAELIGWDFADKPIPYSTLEGKDVYILDLPCDAPVGAKFPQDGSKTLNMKGAYYGTNSLTWIDHHKSAIDSHPKDAITIPGYRIDGVAACRLAWQWFTAQSRLKEQGSTDPEWIKKYPLPQKQDFIDRKVEEPIAVRLAGEYDIWDKRDPKAELFQHGLRSRGLTPYDWNQMLSVFRPSVEDVEKMMSDGLSHDLINPDGTSTPMTVYGLLDSGMAVQYSQRKQDEFIAKNRSFDVQWEGLKFMAINAVRCNSLTFEAATRPDHDALMGFFWNGKEWSVSLYHAPHRKDLDLSAIAVRYGGGGHKGACGFRAKALPFLQC